MKTLQEKYNAILEGNFSKKQFVRDARLAHSNLITQFNSFADTVAILKNKGMVVEAKKAEVTAYKKPEVDPIDMVAPDLLDHGIEAELHAAGITGTPSEEEYAKAKEKAAKELIKDPLCYKNAQTMTEPGEKMEKAKLSEETALDRAEDHASRKVQDKLGDILNTVAEKPASIGAAFRKKVLADPTHYGKMSAHELEKEFKKFKLEEGYEDEEKAGDHASHLMHLDTMQSAGVIDKDAMFVNIGYDKSVVKYNSLDALKAAIEKMPEIGLESAEDDLTQSDLNKARQLFQQVKSNLDGTKNYKLVARLSILEDLGKEFYIWTTSTKAKVDEAESKELKVGEKVDVFNSKGKYSKESWWGPDEYLYNAEIVNITGEKITVKDINDNEYEIDSSDISKLDESVAFPMWKLEDFAKIIKGLPAPFVLESNSQQETQLKEAVKSLIKKTLES